MRILVTGAAGFINGYLVPELLEAGHDVIGVDDFSKYGRLTKSYDDHPRYRFVEGDAKDVALLTDLAADCDQVVAAAAMIGGISYFHEFAYDLLAENERILASTFDAAIAAHKAGHLERIVVVSSSMVYESSTVFPTPEGAQLTSPPPISTYGFQKLASEYFAKGAWEQFQLPYTIVRPFNCVGIGERRAVRDTDIMSGNVKLALSHVVPDLVLKVLKGQDPLHILGEGNQVRHYTYGGDLAHGIRLAMESPAAVNDDFNLSTAASTTVLELAEAIWHKIHTDGRPFHYVSDAPFEHDVQLRVPDVRKARDVLGFEATTTLDTMLDEVIPWIRGEVGGGPAVTVAPELADRPARLQRGRGGRAGPARADGGRSYTARDRRRLRLRRRHDGPGHRPPGGRDPGLRGLRNDLGRGVLNAMKAGIAGDDGTLRPDLDGRRLRRAARRRPDGRPRARRRRRRLGLALHARRAPGGRAARSSA